MKPILNLVEAPDPDDAVMDLDFVKVALEADSSNRMDDQITGWVNAAAAQAERLRGEVLMPQTWEMILPAFPTSERFISLRPRPVDSVLSVTYRSGGAQATFGTLSGSPQSVEEYELINNPSDPLLMLRGGASWPTGATDVRIRLACGYDSIPFIVRTGILLLVGHWYEHREDANGEQMTRIPNGVRDLLSRPKAG